MKASSEISSVVGTFGAEEGHLVRVEGELSRQM